LRLLHAGGNRSSSGEWVGELARGARIDDAAELLAAMPPSSALRRSSAVWGSDELQGRMGGSGLYDLLLHDRDVPYTRDQLVADAASSGLAVVGWLTPALYEVSSWAQRCTGAVAPCALAPPVPLLWQRLAALGGEVAATAAELLGGHARKHHVFLQPSPRRAPLTSPPLSEPSPLSRDLAPCTSNLSAGTVSLLEAHAGRNLTVVSELQGAPLARAYPPQSSAILRLLDCRTSLAQVSRQVMSQTGISEQGFQQQWLQLYTQLRGLGFLTMTDVWL